MSTMDEFEKELDEALNAYHHSESMFQARSVCIALHRAALEDAERYRYTRLHPMFPYLATGTHGSPEDGDKAIDAARSKS